MNVIIYCGTVWSKSDEALTGRLYHVLKYIPNSSLHAMSTQHSLIPVAILEGQNFYQKLQALAVIKI